MIRFLTTSMVLHFWASPQHTIDRLLQMSDNACTGRASLQALSPGFPHGDPPEPPPKPAGPIPTDVPMPEPMDVPVPEPRDVPVPEPGTVPKPAKPRPAEKDPQPRRVP